MSQPSLEPLHPLHPYCARFPSEIVEAALERYTSPGDSVFDPFCGSGTTLVACLAHRRQVVGTDIDVLAGMLSAVKCVPYASERYAAWRAQFRLDSRQTSIRSPGTGHLNRHPHREKCSRLAHCGSIFPSFPS